MAIYKMTTVKDVDTEENIEIMTLAPRELTGVISEADLLARVKSQFNERGKELAPALTRHIVDNIHNKSYTVYFSTDFLEKVSKLDRSEILTILATREKFRKSKKTEKLAMLNSSDKSKLRLDLDLDILVSVQYSNKFTKEGVKEYVTAWKFQSEEAEQYLLKTKYRDRFHSPISAFGDALLYPDSENYNIVYWNTNKEVWYKYLSKRIADIHTGLVYLCLDKKTVMEEPDTIGSGKRLGVYDKEGNFVGFVQNVSPAEPDAKGAARFNILDERGKIIARAKLAGTVRYKDRDNDYESIRIEIPLFQRGGKKNALISRLIYCIANGINMTALEAADPKNKEQQIHHGDDISCDRNIIDGITIPEKCNRATNLQCVPEMVNLMFTYIGDDIVKALLEDLLDPRYENEAYNIYDKG